MDIFPANYDRITELCKRHSVSSLFAFGSVLTNKFSDHSDIDLIVDFNNIEPRDYADNYFDLKFSLEEIFHRSVDLLEEKAIKNPYFKKSIDSSKKLLWMNQ